MNKLTATQISKAKAGARPQKLADGGGLFLFVQPTGAKWWRFRYMWQSREKMISLGTYPDVSLAQARDRRDAARRDIAAGTDPSAKRQAERAALADTFTELAEEWFAKQDYAEKTKKKVRWVLDALLLPKLGREPVREIDAPAALRVLRKIESNGHHESAHRARQVLGQVLRYGVASGRADRDVSADLKDALAPVKTENRAAITDPRAFGVLLVAIDNYHGQFTSRAYLQLLARVITRPGELRQAEWSEFDLDNAQWVVPAERMKMRREHIVPLATQVVTLLRSLRELTGHQPLLFPSHKAGRTISDGMAASALKNMGYAADVHQAHGFRSSASTLLHERGHDSAVIELCLAHADQNKVRAIYNRAERLADRKALMQAWADQCDELTRAAIQSSTSSARQAIAD